jgi:hypothetical protein
LSLERFREPEIRSFLERWFVAVETALGEDTEVVRQRGREVAGDLFERIVAAPEIFALAANPLMLQIIALVHRDRGALPERRVELYDECTNVLLEHWDRAKKGLDVRLTAKEARRVLQPVAYWMHQVPERHYAKRRELLPLIRGVNDVIKPVLLQGRGHDVDMVVHHNARRQVIPRALEVFEGRHHQRPLRGREIGFSALEAPGHKVRGAGEPPMRQPAPVHAGGERFGHGFWLSTTALGRTRGGLRHQSCPLK